MTTDRGIATAIAIVRTPSVSLCTFQPVSFRLPPLLSFQNIEYYVECCIYKIQ